MRHLHPFTHAAAGLLVLSVTCVFGQDWPQWRGPSRDAKASGFTAPKIWPQELSRKWSVPVGLGDATPALVGNRLYVFVRQDANEVLRCLDTSNGQELWHAQYEAAHPAGPSAAQHSGPRSSPAVAEGKVVTLGVGGILTCVDAEKGKLLWRKDDFSGAWPKFYTASSPLLTEGLCIAQLGGEANGGIVAYDLTTGTEKWKWTGDGTAYASPVLLSVSGTRMLVTLTAKKIVGVGVSDGKLLWEAPFPAQGRAYNAATPLVEGQTVIYTGLGRGTKAVKIEKTAEGFAAKELWSNADNAVQFNTPLLKAGCLYGLSQSGVLFCLDAQNGKALWTTTLGGRGFGSIVDGGSVLLALTPDGALTVFEPSDKEYKKLNGYKVTNTETYTYPVLSGNGLFVKDKEAVSLWMTN